MPVHERTDIEFEKNRGRTPRNATPVKTKYLVSTLAEERYRDVNHTHLSELLAEREGVV